MLGLEAWVKVCKTMRVKSGLPAVMESVCTAVAGVSNAILHLKEQSQMLQRQPQKAATDVAAAAAF